VGESASFFLKICLEVEQTEVLIYEDDDVMGYGLLSYDSL